MSIQNKRRMKQDMYPRLLRKQCDHVSRSRIDIVDTSCRKYNTTCGKQV